MFVQCFGLYCSVCSVTVDVYCVAVFVVSQLMCIVLRVDVTVLVDVMCHCVVCCMLYVVLFGFEPQTCVKIELILISNKKIPINYIIIFPPPMGMKGMTGVNETAMK